MSIKGLDRVINENFLSRLSRVAGSSSSSGPSASGSSSSSGKALKGQALYDSLRVGARNFAAGVQLLNSTISFVNVSLDVNEKLLAIVDKAQDLTKIANKGNISASTAARYRRDFEKFAKEFDDLIEEATSGAEDLLSVEDLGAALDKAGLFGEDIPVVDRYLSKIQSPTETSIDAEGTVSADGNPIPLESFRRALRAAVVDPDVPGEDNSGFFGKVESALKEVRLKLSGNIKALKQTQEFVGDNLKLVRAAGLAFLDLSNSISGTESAEFVASELRRKIRAGAGGALGQAGNMEAVQIAGLAALSNAKTS